MIPDKSSPCTLSMHWTPATASTRGRYELTLTNHSSVTLEKFSLSFTGPARIDLKGLPLENAVLLRRISNHTEVMMPGDASLAPGAAWTFIVHGTQNPLRHWSDAARAAWLTLASGRIVEVAVGICQSTLAETGEPRLDDDPPGDMAAIEQGLAIVPWPASVRVEGVRTAATLALNPQRPAAIKAARAFEAVVASLFPGETICSNNTGATVVEFAAGELAEEAYEISFGPAVTVTASTANGYLYALVTLGQILRAARLAPEHCQFPARGFISDGPRFAWRGAHLDVARQFYPLAEIEAFTATMAWNKLNRLHLHLTEDEAWRFEVSAYPELTRIGAFQGAGHAIPPLLGSGSELKGGFYTRSELKALVTLAAGRAIDIVPEIDVPGHSFAALTALPQLRDPGENEEYRSIQGFPNNCLNAGVPAAREFARTVFRELMEIFPSRCIHVGADEVPADAWTGSPLAKARLAQIGGTGPQDLQADFLRSLHAQISAAGRTAGAWEEGAHGGGIAPQNSYLVAWQNVAIGSQLAAQGYDVVMSPAQAYYFDMARSTDWWEPGATWAGVSSVENTYRFDPLTGFAPEFAHKMIGVQACIWSEPMSDRRNFRRLVFPRLSAIAETGWTDNHRRSWPRFAATSHFMMPQEG